MGGVDDPVAARIVSNLARPGGNITVFSSLSAELDGKRFELLKELIPDLPRVVVLSNQNNPICTIALQGLRPAAETLGAKLDLVELGRRASLSRRSVRYARRARRRCWCSLTCFFSVSASGSPNS
jgi:ABC-type uncharacterized transport system substrate-binding protein